MSEVVSIIDTILFVYSSCPANHPKLIEDVGIERASIPSSQGLGQDLQSSKDTGTPAASSAVCVSSGSSVRITAKSCFRRFIATWRRGERYKRHDSE